MKIETETFTFPFREERWVNKAIIAALLGALASVIFITVIPLMGYAVEVLRRTIRTGQPSLPAWDDWGRLIGDGLRYFLVSIVYLLPVILIYTCAGAAFFLPVMVGGALADITDSDALAALFGLGTLAAYTIFFIVILVSLVLVLGLGYFSAVAVVRMTAQNNALAAAFDFRAVMREGMAHLEQYGIALAISAGTYFAANFIASLLYVTVVLLCVSPVIQGAVIAYFYVISAALFGLAYRDVLTKAPASKDVPPVLPAV